MDYSLCQPDTEGGCSIFLPGKPDIAGKNVFRFAPGAALAGFIAVITLSGQRILQLPDDILFMWAIRSVALLMSVLVLNLSRQDCFNKADVGVDMLKKYDK